MKKFNNNENESNKHNKSPSSPSHITKNSSSMDQKLDSNNDTNKNTKYTDNEKRKSELGNIITYDIDNRTINNNSMIFEDKIKENRKYMNNMTKRIISLKDYSENFVRNECSALLDEYESKSSTRKAIEIEDEEQNTCKINCKLKFYYF